MLKLECCKQANSLTIHLKEINSKKTLCGCLYAYPQGERASMLFRNCLKCQQIAKGMNDAKR